MRTRLACSAFALPLLALALTGCDREPGPDGTAAIAAGADTVAGSRAPSTDGVAMGYSDAGAKFVHTIGGFAGPESVRYDAELDVFYVSNMTGYGSAANGNGYIVRVSASDPDSGALVLASGGRNGVELDSPKGMILHGDTLWVCDIDKLRAFNRRTGAPLATIDFGAVGAVQLNDVALAPDGTLRVTDTGIIMSPKGVIHTGPDRIFSVGPGGTIAEMASGLQLRQPNGITWDSAGRHWVVVSFDPFVGEVASMNLDGTGRRVLRTGTGNLDGVEALPDGRILFASWADSSVHLLAGTSDTRLVRQVPEPADIGVDTRRNRLAIPLSTLDRVELWTIPGAGAQKDR
jgi:sugar lactone lactonase YvrE